MQNAATKFKKLFKDVFSEYDYTELKDVTGFSLRGRYPKEFVQRLGVDKGYQYVPYFNYYLDFKNEITKKSMKLIPMIVRVEFSLRSEAGDESRVRYLLDDEHVKSKVHKPINIKADEFYFNSATEDFYIERKNQLKSIGLADIHKRVFKLHLAKYTSWDGVKARIKIGFLRALPKIILRLASAMLGSLHWIINGQYYSYDPIMAELEDELNKKKINPSEVETEREIDFFGYKVRIWTLTSYSLIVILLISLAPNRYFSELLTMVNDTALLNAAIAIASIVLYDKLLPLGIKKFGRIVGNKIFTLNVKGVTLDV